MIKSISSFLIILIVLYLSSCAGGSIGGLIPAPKFLDGKVEGNTYFSVEGAFKVRLPHPPTNSKDDEYEWTYTKVDEIKDKGVVGVIFGPAAFDRNMYHAVLVRAPMKDPKEEYVSDVFSKKVQSRNGAYIQKEYTNFQLNGKQCFYAVYESDKAFLILSLTDNESSFYAVEADILKKRGAVSDSDADYSRTAWPIFNNMLESFIVLNDKYKI